MSSALAEVRNMVLRLEDRGRPPVLHTTEGEVVPVVYSPHCGNTTYYLNLRSQKRHTYIDLLGKNALDAELGLRTYAMDTEDRIGPGSLGQRRRSKYGFSVANRWDRNGDLVAADYGEHPYFAMYLAEYYDSEPFGPWDRYKGEHHIPFPGSPDNLMGVNDFLREPVRWSVKPTDIISEAIIASGIPSLRFR